MKMCGKSFFLASIDYTLYEFLMFPLRNISVEEIVFLQFPFKANIKLIFNVVLINEWSNILRLKPLSLQNEIPGKSRERNNKSKYLNCNVENLSTVVGSSMHLEN